MASPIEWDNRLCRMFRLVRSPLLSISLGFIFAHLSGLIPVKRLRETPTLLAFYHPQLSYPVHIVIVPKKALPSLAALSPADTPFLIDLFKTADSLAAELNLHPNDYQLVLNGGAYQAVPQLHVHLISDKSLTHR